MKCRLEYTPEIIEPSKDAGAGQELYDSDYPALRDQVCFILNRLPGSLAWNTGTRALGNPNRSVQRSSLSMCKTEQTTPRKSWYFL